MLEHDGEEQKEGVFKKDAGIVGVEAFVVLYSQDLMFESRVEGACRLAGLSLRQVSRMDACIELAGQAGCAALLLDLEATGLVCQELISTLSMPRPTVIAYGPHVRGELLESASVAGCDQVMPRSQFVNQLQAVLDAARHSLDDRDGPSES